MEGGSAPLELDVATAASLVGSDARTSSAGDRRGLAVFSAAAAFAWQAFGPTERHSRPAHPSPTPSPYRGNPLADLPDGWSELPPPPEVRSQAAAAWTGRELLIWGGYVFDGSGDKPPNSDGFVFDAPTRSWSAMPESPLSSRSAAASAWTGSELLVWGGWDGTWDSGPGVLGDGAAYDPATDSWRTIAEAPIELTDGTAVWTGQEMIVFGAALHGGNNADTLTAIGAAYDPAADTWRPLPDSMLSPQASTAAWDGREMIAWDYLNGSAAYDPDSDSWRELPKVPLDARECSPNSVAVGNDVLGDYCGAIVLFVSARDR